VEAPLARGTSPPQGEVALGARAGGGRRWWHARRESRRGRLTGDGGQVGREPGQPRIGKGRVVPTSGSNRWAAEAVHRR
jgi:hypothetical protein